MRLRSHRSAILVLLTVAIGCEDPGAPASCDPDNTLEAYFPFTMEREICFQDPTGEVLTYDVAISNPVLADIALIGTTLTGTGKDAGYAEITVTAMDPEGHIGTATYDLTVRPAWRAWISACDAWYVDGGEVETAIQSWIQANVVIAAIRYELYVDGELLDVSHWPGLSTGELVGFGGGWRGSNTVPPIECSHVIDAQLIVTQL